MANLTMVCAVGVLATLLLASTAGASSGPLSFGAPAQIDGQPPFSSLAFVTAVACGTPTTCAATGSADWTTSDGGADWSTSAPPANLGLLSCAGGSLCVSVDNAGGVARSTDGGVTWTSTAQLSVAGVGFGDVPTSVSCAPAGGACVVVASAGEAFVSTDGGQTWSVGEQVQSGGPSTAGLTAVSCIDGGTCVAVDSNGNAWVTADVTAVSPTWTATSIDSVSLYGVSCVDAGSCVAVDARGNALATVNVTGTAPWRKVATGDATALTAVSCATQNVCAAIDGRGGTVVSEDATAPSPGWSPVSAGTWVPRSVSCPSSTLCVAGATGGGTGSLLSLDPMNPGTAGWSVSLSLGGTNDLTGVSCAAGGDPCAAIDTEGRGLISSDEGATWAPATLTGPAAPLLGVSCASEGCVALEVASPGVFISAAPGADAPPGWSASTIDPGNYPQAVSCADGGLCVAVDGAGDTVTSTDFDGTTNTTWTVSLQDLDGNGNPVGLTGVSCPSTSLCAAVDGDGNAMISTDPAATDWSLPAAIDSGPLTGVSCTAHGLCVAIDGSGDVMISTNATSASPTWSAPTNIYPSALNRVSCDGSGLCVVAASDGTVLYSTDPGSAAPTWTVSDTSGAHVDDVSCVDTGLCLAVDDAGEALVGTSSVAGVALSASSAAFGPTVIGASAPAQSFTLSNSGGATLNVGGASLTGGDASQFALTADTCDGRALAPGDTCTFAVSFTPTTPGVHGDASVAVSSDAASSPASVALTGTGVVASTTPGISISGGPGSFGHATVGDKSRARTYKITSTGPAGSVLHIVTAALVGANPKQFTGSDHGCAGAKLAAGGSCSIQVSFAPSRAGSFTAKLSVVSDAPSSPAVVALSGSGRALGTFRFARVRERANGVIALSLRLPAQGEFVVRTSTVPRTAGARTIVYSPTALRKAKAAGTAALTIRPDKAAAAALRRAGKLRVSILVTYTPTGRTRETKTTAAMARRR